MKTVLVTDLEYRKAEKIFSAVQDLRCLCAPSNEHELAEMAKRENAFAVIIGVEKYTGELYDALPAGGVIARFGIGHDGVDKALAAKKSLFCTITPGVSEQSVAECAVGMMMMAAKNFVPCATECRQGMWQNRVGFELAGRTLVIAGCGKIGSKVAAIARHGFGMHVIGCDVVAPRSPELFDEFTTSPQEAFEKADILSIHVPALPATRDYINPISLSWLKPTAWLINTSRGNNLDENALFDAIQSGRLAGAVLDVCKKEPYSPMVPEKDLRTLENVFILPHLGSSTQEACDRMALAALENVRYAVAGEFSKMATVPPPPGK